jgi:hypothetical protein
MFLKNCVVSTPINVDVLEHELRDHPNKYFVQQLVHGLREGFDTGIQQLPTTSYMCTNLQSALKQPDVVTQLLDKELQRGYVIGPFATPPFKVFRISPLGVAEHKYSKKQRLIVDLSAPHDSAEHSSLNDLIDKESYSVSYVTIDDAIAIIKRLGQGSMLTKTDVVDAFKQVPIKRDLWPFHGVEWNGKYYFFVRLCFGSRSSPKLFTMLSEAIHYIATHSSRMENLLFLLDDFLAIDRPNTSFGISLNVFHTMFDSLNIPIHPNKRSDPIRSWCFWVSR